MLTKGTKTTIWMGGICLFHFIGMLVFRAFIYASMNKAPEDPYGISDIIELFLFCIFLILLFVSFLLSMILIIKGSNQTKKASLYLIVFSILLYIIFSPLHHLAAKLSYQ
jgi:hypothetical protein